MKGLLAELDKLINVAGFKSVCGRDRSERIGVGAKGLCTVACGFGVVGSNESGQLLHLNYTAEGIRNMHHRNELQERG